MLNRAVRVMSVQGFPSMAGKKSVSPKKHRLALHKQRLSSLYLFALERYKNIDVGKETKMLA